MFASDDAANKSSEAAAREHSTEERKVELESQERDTKDAITAKGYCSQEGGSTQTETAFPRRPADTEGVLTFKSESKPQRPAAVELTPRKRQFEPGTDFACL